MVLRKLGGRCVELSRDVRVYSRPGSAVVQTATDGFHRSELVASGSPSTNALVAGLFLGTPIALGPGHYRFCFSPADSRTSLGPSIVAAGPTSGPAGDYVGLH